MGWDRGVDYEFAYHTLLSLIKSSSTTDTQKCYLVIALIQLRNGSRVSEAARAFKTWLATGRSEVEVEVSKRKRSEKRLMVIPREVQVYRHLCIELGFAQKSTESITKTQRLFYVEKQEA
jgi:hypothetical protein